MVKLSEVPTGSIVVLEKVPEPASMYKMLMAYGIFRGTQVKILRNDAWQQMILVEVDGKRVAIRRSDVKSIEVIALKAE